MIVEKEKDGYYREDGRKRSDGGKSRPVANLGEDGKKVRTQEDDGSVDWVD